MTTSPNPFDITFEDSFQYFDEQSIAYFPFTTPGCEVGAYYLLDPNQGLTQIPIAPSRSVYDPRTLNW